MSSIRAAGRYVRCSVRRVTSELIDALMMSVGSVQRTLRQS